MAAVSLSPRIPTGRGFAYAATRSELAAHPRWKTAFANHRQDHRYYEIVEDTIKQDFDYRYLVLEDAEGNVRAFQPLFLLNQDLLAGTGQKVQRLVAKIRRIFPRFLTIRTVMVGCTAGEGHLDDASEEDAAWIGECLHASLSRYARQVRAPMIVLKEFGTAYRRPLAALKSNGYTRVPSLPYTRLALTFASFEEYLAGTLSKATRKDLRRKFKKTAEADPIELTVVQDVTPFVDEVYPLYLQVYGRSVLQFEKLTKEFMCRLGQEMPEKTRFFIWRQNGKAVAFSLCMIHQGELHDGYLGMDYSVALDLHLYFYTLRDIIEWALNNGCHGYSSSALNYDPKARLKCQLLPMDLYVTHTFGPMNFILRKVLPLLEPTRSEKALRNFPNFDALWGDA